MVYSNKKSNSKELQQRDTIKSNSNILTQKGYNKQLHVIVLSKQIK